MAQDDTYQTKAYHVRDADAYMIGSGGNLTFWSGATLSANSVGNFICESNFEFFFNDQTISADRMLNFLIGRTRWSVIINSAGTLSNLGGTTNPPILPSMMGYIVFSLADAASNASARLHSAKAGEDLVIMMRGIGSTGSVIIYFSGNAAGLSGVAVIGQSEDALSRIHINNSATSFGFIRLIGVEDGVWAVVDAGQSRGTGACVDEQPAA